LQAPVPEQNPGPAFVMPSDNGHPHSSKLEQARDSRRGTRGRHRLPLGYGDQVYNQLKILLNFASAGFTSRAFFPKELGAMKCIMGVDEWN
jgi:hypothetical protein